MIERPVLFVHIPKTAGTSVRTLVGRAGAGRTVDMPLRAGERARVAARIGAADVVMGHVGYGLRASFPTPPFVFTFLRDPIDRSLSNFSFLQQRRPAPGVAEDESDFAAAEGKSLAAFLRDEPAAASRHLGNLHVWFLTRDGIDARGDLRGLGRDDLSAATGNLEKCDVVGLAERMTESLLLLFLGLGLSPEALRPVPFENVLRSRIRREDVDPETMGLLESGCALDLELYRFGRELFRKRFARELPRVAAWLEGGPEGAGEGEGVCGVLDLVRDEARARFDSESEAREEEIRSLNARIARQDAALESVRASAGWRLIESLRGVAGRRWNI
ncbi:MAG: hypothetical protein U0529_22135 [Thermoanaerobaculia bacterium]